MTTLMFAVICSIISFIFSVLSFILVILTYINYVAANKSTHSIQYIPVEDGVKIDENGFEVLTKEQKKLLEDDDDEIEL